MIRTEVAVLPEDDNNALAVQVRQTREQLGEKFRAQAEQLQKLEQDLISIAAARPSSNGSARPLVSSSTISTMSW